MTNFGIFWVVSGQTQTVNPTPDPSSLHRKLSYHVNSLPSHTTAQCFASQGRPCQSQSTSPSGIVGVAAGVALGGLFLASLLLLSGRSSTTAKSPGPSLANLPVAATELPSLWLEDLTWVEIAQAQQRGFTTVIIPTGGTEQNGPHLTTGKHNQIVSYTAQEIAKRSGQTLIAPVLAYVPEEPHIQYPGTISLPAPLFQQVVEAAGDSLLQQGFRVIVLMGDSGGNQEPLQKAAEALQNRWGKQQRTVLFLSDYYAGHGQEPWLADRGFSHSDCGTHAGLADTAELLAIQPAAVRRDSELVKRSDLGHDGRPELATPELGQELLELKINAALNQLAGHLPPSWNSDAVTNRSPRHSQ